MGRGSRKPGPFDDDPKFKELRRIRKDEGYKGSLDQDGKKVSCPVCKKPGCTASVTERCNG